MLRLGRGRGQVRVVTDQKLSPTYTVDLAMAIWRIAEHRGEGIFHITNADSCTWFEFARAIFEQSGLNVQVDATTSAEFGARAHRPAYSVLGNARLAELDVPQMRTWREALSNYLECRKVSVPS